MTRPLIAIDLDDTLYPERDWARQRLSFAARLIESRAGVLGIEAAALAAFDRTPCSRQPLQEAVDQLGSAPLTSHLADAVAEMERFDAQVAPFPDVAEVLESLRTIGTLVLLTEGNLTTQTAKVRALRLGDFFTHMEIVELGAKATGKPYQKLRALFSSAPWFAMIGDNPAKDVIPARREGYATYLVRRPSVRYVHDVTNDDSSVECLAAVLAIPPLSQAK